MPISVVLTSPPGGGVEKGPFSNREELAFVLEKAVTSITAPLVPFAYKFNASAVRNPPVATAVVMPGLFSRRRIDVAQRAAKGLSVDVIALTFLAETRLAAGDIAGARKALEEATASAPSLAGAQLQLGLLYEQAGDLPRAAERYRLTTG